MGRYGILIYIYFSFSSILIAQNGKIEGRIVSSSNTTGVAYATVKFTNEIGEFSNENGEFLIENLPLGSYNLVITCIGFEKLELPVIKLTEQSPTKNLSDVVLTEKSIQIAEVTITEQQKVYDTRYSGTNNVISVINLLMKMVYLVMKMANF